MSEPYVGQITAVAFGIVPKGWALCNGQILAIAQNQALFSLLGTTYGGNGVTTFALPDLRGRTPIHWGTGPGLSTIAIGQAAGTENVTLTVNQLPMHNHIAMASTITADQPVPGGHLWATESAGATAMYSDQNPSGTMSQNALGSAGGNQPHNNMQPYLTISFIIALQGIFPSRN